ncbi:NAD(P)/FAD-dependent oxidoreductase [Roseomonas sp. CCTCC AB2023176]|uniref:NAD(P)/FAD-dependent oxidoreductase n=1 Tax=Roseomonas sp. CCTCC AB2023176 TaxID=3342640 RepID=UPI0035E3B5E9
MTFTTGPTHDPEEALDALVIGGGPAGLTAALYLARFGRRFALVDEGDPRAAWIPTSHNIPFFAEGIGGAEILGRARDHAGRYGAVPLRGSVTALTKEAGGFTAHVEAEGAPSHLRARRVLLATGAQDVEPDLPDLQGAIRRGLIRYCPICDGYEARGRRIGVVGHGTRGLGEAVFIARTYSGDVTLMTLGKSLDLTEEDRRRIAEHRIRVVEEPVAALEIEGDRIAAVQAGGARHGFDVLYSALGLTLRSGLATALGAEHDDAGALIVDDHNQTTVPGLYAAGAIVRGLDQVVVAMGHAAVAATAIHNRCEIPTEDEPENRT